MLRVALSCGSVANTLKSLNFCFQGCVFTRELVESDANFLNFLLVAVTFLKSYPHAIDLLGNSYMHTSNVVHRFLRKKLLHLQKLQKHTWDLGPPNFPLQV